MDVKGNFLVNTNDDKTITIFDIEKDKFYMLNDISSIIFENINLSVNEIVSIIGEIYEVNELEIYSEIDLEKTKLLELFE